MNLKFLDKSGIDDLHFIKKEVLIHTILKPVLNMHDKEKNADLCIYSARKTDVLIEEYGKTYLNKLDGIYNKMLFDEQVLLVQLVQDEDIKLACKAGYLHDAVFTVFKDELLKVSSAFFYLTTIDPKTYLQENFN